MQRPTSYFSAVFLGLFLLCTNISLNAAYPKTKESFYSLIVAGKQDVCCGFLGSDKSKIFYSFVQNIEDKTNFRQAGDRIMHLYDVATGKFLREENFGPNVVFGPVFSNDAQKMAWVSKVSPTDYIVKMCDVGTGYNQYEWPCCSTRVPSPKFSQNGEDLIWIKHDPDSKKHISRFHCGCEDCQKWTFYSDMVDCVLSPTLAHMAQVFKKPSDYYDGPNFAIRLIDVNPRKELTIDCWESDVTSVDICMDGKFLTYKNKEVTRLYDVYKNKIVHSEKNVIFSTFSPNLELWLCVTSVGNAQKIKIFDMASEKLNYERDCIINSSNLPKFSTEGRRLAFLGSPSMIVLYNTATKALYKTLDCRTSYIPCFDFNADGSKIIWTAVSGEIVADPVN